MCEEKEDLFWFDGFPCEKIGTGEVSIGRDEPGIFKELTVYGNIDPVKSFNKDVVIPTVVVEETTKTKYKVTKIRRSCFDNAGNIETLSIPESVSDMKWCFYGCNNLREIHIDPNNTKYCDVQGVVYSKDRKVLLVFPPAYPAEEYHILPATREIGNLAFKTASRLKKLFVPNSVQSIGINAFYGCSALEHVYIEGKLKYFGGNNEGDYYPQDTVFHYQGKEMNLGELAKEVNKKIENSTVI